MKPKTMRMCSLIGGVAAFVITLPLWADSPPQQPAGKAVTKSDALIADHVTVAEARERAKLMHQIYASTLDVVHHYYFRTDRAVLPARAMEKVFAQLDEETKIQARWIAVNTEAMSINHEPATEFEKKAAAEIAGGKAAYEAVERGFYRRAGAIPLGAGCVGCHTKLSSTPVKSPRFAGLVISIPVAGK